MGLEVTDGTTSRVLLGIVGGTPALPIYGFRVISSDGSTVIIDGTSDMFKISATGTASVGPHPGPKQCRSLLLLLLLLHTRASADAGPFASLGL